MSTFGRIRRRSFIVAIGWGCALVIVWTGAIVEEYKVPITTSLVLTWIAWLSSGRSLASFQGLTVLVLAVLYPLSAILNGLLPVPPMHPELWDVGTTGLVGYSVGMGGLIVSFLAFRCVSAWRHGVWTVQSIPASLRDFRIRDQEWLNRAFFLVTVFYVVAFAGAYYGGYFYHEYTDFESANTWFFLGYAKYVTFALCALILHHYLLTRSRKALALFILALAELFLFFGLSGSRAVLVFPILYWMAYGLSVSNNITRRGIRLGRLTVGIGILVGVIVLNAGWASFRAFAQEDFGFGNRLAALGEAAYSLVAMEHEWSDFDELFVAHGLIGHIGYRLHEFGWAGRAIESFRGEPSAGLEGFGRVPEFILPSFVRITPYWESSDVVAISVAINADLTTGAPPLTTVGDLYRRFGYPGIAVGMAFIGTVLAAWDLFFWRPTLVSRLHFLLFWFHMSTTHITLGIQEFLVQSIRPFILTWLIACCLGFWLRGLQGMIVRKNHLIQVRT